MMERMCARTCARVQQVRHLALPNAELRGDSHVVLHAIGILRRPAHRPGLLCVLGGLVVDADELAVGGVVERRIHADLLVKDCGEVGDKR